MFQPPELGNIVSRCRLPPCVLLGVLDAMASAAINGQVMSFLSGQSRTHIHQQARSGDFGYSYSFESDAAGAERYTQTAASVAGNTDYKAPRRWFHKLGTASSTSQGLRSGAAVLRRFDCTAASVVECTSPEPD